MTHARRPVTSGHLLRRVVDVARRHAYFVVALVIASVLLPLAAGALLSTGPASDRNWYWSNPQPQGNGLTSTSWVTTSTGYACGNAGVMLKSVDGGASWTALDPVTTKDLTGVSFVSASTGWVVGISGTVKKTVDGGSTWTTETAPTTPPARNFRSVSFFDASHGVVVGDVGATTSTIDYTSDGGATWRQASTAAAQSLSSVWMTSATTAWAVGANGTLLRSTDGGANWTVRTSGTTVGLSAITFITGGTNGYFVGNAASPNWTIYSTHNNGNSWSAVAGLGSGPVNLLAVACSDANNVVVVGASGQVRRTTDGGVTWLDQSQNGYAAASLRGVDMVDANNVRMVGDEGVSFYTTNGGAQYFACGAGTTSAFYASSFVDANHGWVVGANGTIMRTTDAGATWQQQAAGTTNWRGVYFADTAHGWIVGDSGAMRATTDGKNWTALTSGSTNQLNGVWFTSLTTGFAVGNGGTILRTVNGGSSWTAMPSGTTQNLNAVWFADANNGYAVGAAGTIRKTINGGSTWTTSTSGTTQTMLTVRGVSATQVWAAGNAGAICKTTNGGTSAWTVTTAPAATQPVRTLAFTNATTGWFGSTYGAVLKTTDGGSTWTTQSAGLPTSTADPQVGLYSLSAVDANTLFIAGDDGIVSRSLNGGVTWSSLQYGTLANLYAISAPDASNGWVTGAGGVVLHTANGGQTWSRQRTGSLSSLSSIAMVDAMRGWAVGDSGVLRRTDNGGSTWQAQASGTTTNLVEVASADGTQAIVAGAGIVKYTLNSGSTWTTVPAAQAPAQTITGLCATDSSHTWVTTHVSGGSQVWLATAGGATWTSLLSTSTVNLYGVYFRNNTTGYAVGDVGGVGVVLATTNAGATWARRTTGATTSFNAVRFSDADNGIAVGTGGVIARTSDGGTTWTLQASGTSGRLSALGYFAGSTAFVAGDSGSLLRSADIIPPVTTLAQSPAQPSGTNGWYKATAPTITLTSSELGATYYSWASASGPFTGYPPEFDAIEGSSTLFYYSVDQSNNIETVKSALFKVDLTPPTAPSSVTTDVVATSTAQVSWTPGSDLLSGVAYYNVSVDGSWVASTTATTAFLSGLDPNSFPLVSVQTVDGAGNTATTDGTVVVHTNTIDETPLTTQAMVEPSSPDGANGWYVTQPVIQLVTMPFGVSASTFYSWTDAPGSYAPYTPGTPLMPLPGVTHLYVSTWDPNGVRFAEPTQTVTFAVDLDTPAVPAVTATATGYQSIVATWPAVSDPPSSIARYDVALNGAPYTSVTTPAVDIVGLAQQTTYTVSVVAVSSAGATSQPSPTATATTLPAPLPNAPAVVYAKAPAGTYVYVNWLSATGTVGATSYRVYRSFDGVSYSAIGTSTGAYNVTYVDTGLTPSTRYWYAVSTVDDRGEGPLSSTAPATWGSIAPLTGPPARPQGIMSFGASGTVAVEWSMDSTAGITGYYVLRTPASLSTTVTTLTPVPVTTQAFIDHTAVNGETYYYSVRAKDATGDIGFPSLESEGKPQAPPGGTGLDPHVYGSGGGSCFCHSTHTSAGTGPQIRFPIRPPVVVCDRCHPPSTALGEFEDPQAKSQHSLATTASPGNEFTCLTCHVPIYKAGEPRANLLRVDGSWVCTVVTGVQPGDGFCYSCHGPGSTLPEGDLTSFEKTGHASIPAPATGADVVCDACHESHSSRNEHLNKFSGLMMCMQCHTDTTTNPKEPDIWTRLQLNEDADAKHPLLAQDQADGSQMECQNCHNTHTTTVAFPVVDPHDPSPSGTWTNSRGTEHVFCFTCHNGQPLPTSQETTPWAPPVLASGGAATVADIQTAWNTNVHGFGARSSPTTTTLYLRPDMGYTYATTLECRACHDAHGTLNNFALQQNVVSASGNKTVGGALVTKFTKSDGTSGYDLRFFCSTCHLWDSASHDVASMADTSTVGFPMDCTACHRHFKLDGTPSSRL